MLVDGSSTAQYPRLAAEYVAAAANDGDADIDRLTELARSCDGVTTLSEYSLLTAARVAVRLGLPGAGTRAASIARSKLAQRRAAVEAGLPAPHAVEVREPADIDGFFVAESGPAVLKPVDASASAGVFRVAGAEEARRRWPEVRAFSPSGGSVLETLLEGDEVSAEGCVRDGALGALTVTEKRTGGPTGYVELGHRVAAPSQAEAQRLLRGPLERIVSAWGVESAVVHAEFRIGVDGPVLVEATTRPAGGLIPELVAAASGRDLYLEQADLALGREPSAPDMAVAPFAGVRFLAATGVVRRAVAPVEVLRDGTSVRLAEQLVQPGRRLGEPVANWMRAGYVLGWGDDVAELDRDLEAAAARLAALMGVEDVGGARTA